MEDFEDKGLAWDLLVEQHKITNTMIKVLASIVIAAFMAITAVTGIFIWYLYQYDYSCVTYNAETGEYGNAVINESGEVSINGESTKND